MNEFTNTYREVYPVTDIANYIVDNHDTYKDKFGHSKCINLDRLNKLLYFVQANSLITRRKELFYEPILAWPYGATIEEIRSYYGGGGPLSLWEMKYVYNFKAYNPPEQIKSIQPEDQKIINEVLDLFKNECTLDLVDLIRSQDPFIEAFEKGTGTIISIQSMKDFFLNNKSKNKE